MWAQIDEPEPAVSDPGHIYLWLNVGGTAPRAYVLRYSRRLHEQVQRALKAAKQGRPIGVARAVPGAGHGRSIPGHRRDQLRFFPHPPVLLPPKTH